MSKKTTPVFGVKLVILAMSGVMLLCSCQSSPHRETGDPAQLRERAAAKRAHAAGLQEDMADLAVTIAHAREEQVKLRCRLADVDAEIVELNRTVGELKRDMEGLSTYEAYIRRITLQRWQNRLDTARNRQYTLSGQIISMDNRIKEHEGVREEQRYNAEELTKRAAKLDELADCLEALGPAPEEDFWAQW